MKIATIGLKQFPKATLYKDIDNIIKRRKLNISVNLFFMEDIVCKWDNGSLNVYCCKHNLLDYDVFIFRPDLKSFVEEIYFLAKYLDKNKKIVINQSFCDGRTNSDKVSFINILKKLKLNHPKTYIVNSYFCFKNIIENVKLPVIIKDPHGWMGKEVEKLTSEKDANKFKNYFKSKTGLLIQEYIPVRSNYRVLVVGYKVLGVYKRIAAKNDFRGNLHQGGSGEKAKLSKEMKNIAEKLAKVTKNDVLGVDLLKYKNRVYVLEIENCPGFGGFRKYTGISPTEHLFDYAISVFKKQKR